MLPDLGQLTQVLHVSSIVKVGILVTLCIFLIFLFLVFIQIRSLNRIVTQFPYSGFVVFFSLFLILATLALIAISLAIL